MYPEFRIAFRAWAVKLDQKLIVLVKCQLRCEYYSLETTD